MNTDIYTPLTCPYCGATAEEFNVVKKDVEYKSYTMLQCSRCNHISFVSYDIVEDYETLKSEYDDLKDEKESFEIELIKTRKML